ncbi:hypothetical protein ACFUIZ_32665 [Streptomyces cinereoruber]|uniref:hypothetical protein n=1 Tax=Streptomyces cinereoruber TaxID=67260 RepID=UPI0036438100
MFNRIRRALRPTRARHARNSRRYTALPLSIQFGPDTIRGEETILVRPYVPPVERLLTFAEAI